MDRHRAAEKRKKAGGYFQGDKKIHMYKHKSSGQVFLFVTVLCILVMGFTSTAIGHEDANELLKITVGEPTKLSNRVGQNTASFVVSRTGVVAGFYPKPGTGPKFYRTSGDGGINLGSGNGFAAPAGWW